MLKINDNDNCIIGLRTGRGGTGEEIMKTIIRYETKVTNRGEVVGIHDLTCDYVMTAQQENIYMDMLADEYGNDPTRFTGIEMCRVV